MLEYRLMIEGYNMREEREWERTAQLAAWIMQPHVKRRITAADLYKRKESEPEKRVPTYEESKAFFEESVKKLGLKSL